MTLTKFTSPPWSVDFGLCGWILHGRRPQDVIAATDHDQSLSNREIADALLLASAPDLYAALDAMLDAYEEEGAIDFSVRQKARAALNRAEGRTP